MLLLPTCPNNFYGIAASFYGNEVSVCAVKQGKDEDRPQVIKELSFVEKNPAKIHEAAARFVEVICAVAKLQDEANKAANCDSYALPITIGWNGIEDIPALKGVFPNAPNQEVPIVNSSPELGRIFTTLAKRSQELGLDAVNMELQQAAYIAPKKNAKPDECPYDNLETLSHKSQTGDAQAKQELVALAYQAAVRLWRQLTIKTDPGELNGLAFIEITEPWYEHFNTTETIAAMQAVFREFCKTSREFDFMFASTPHNQRFFNVLRPFMAEQIKYVKQLVELAKQLTNDPQFQALLAAGGVKTVEIQVRGN